MADELKLYRVWWRGALANGGSGEISKLVLAIDAQDAFEVFKDAVAKMELPHTFVWRREDADITLYLDSPGRHDSEVEFVSFDAPLRVDLKTFRCIWKANGDLTGKVGIIKALSKEHATVDFVDSLRKVGILVRPEELQVDEIDAAMKPDPDDPAVYTDAEQLWLKYRDSITRLWERVKDAVDTDEAEDEADETVGDVSLHVDLPGFPRLDITIQDTEDNPRQCLVLIQDMIGKLLGPQAMHVMPNLTAAEARRVQADVNRILGK